MAKLESGVGCHTFHTEHHTGINVILYIYILILKFKPELEM